MPPMPPAGGDPIAAMMGGMPPMGPGAPGAMPMAAGGPPPGGAPPMPQAAPAAGGERPEIKGPLDSLTKILYDSDIMSMVEGNSGGDPQDMATKIWSDFGGLPTGEVDPTKVGNRTKEMDEMDDDSAKNEQKATADQKWLRLPQGKTIKDIFDLNQLSTVMNGLVIGAVRKTANENGGEAGGGGEAAASYRIDTFIRMAAYLDSCGLVRQADVIGRCAK